MLSISADDESPDCYQDFGTRIRHFTNHLRKSGGRSAGSYFMRPIAKHGCRVSACETGVWTGACRGEPRRR